MPEFINWILLGFVIAGIFSSIVIGFVTLPTEQVEAILTENNVSWKEKGLLFLGMQLGLKAITPAFRHNWIYGGTYNNDYRFLIEDFPLPDEVDIIGFLIVFPLFLLFLNIETDSSKALFAKIFFLLLLIPLAYAISKGFYFWLYYYSGTNLGISTQALNSLREIQINLYGNAMLPLFLLSMTTLGIFLKGVASRVLD